MIWSFITFVNNFQFVISCNVYVNSKNIFNNNNNNNNSDKCESSTYLGSLDITTRNRTRYETERNSAAAACPRPPKGIAQDKTAFEYATNFAGHTSFGRKTFDRRAICRHTEYQKRIFSQTRVSLLCRPNIESARCPSGKLFSAKRCGATLFALNWSWFHSSFILSNG
jgi:hypothetical protein